MTDDATEEPSDASAAESEDKTPTDDTSGDRPETVTDGGRTRAGGVGEYDLTGTRPEGGPVDG